MATGPRAGRRILLLCAIGVLLAAADTYVIVLALPDMMLGIGLDSDELQRAAPLVSMFLLGYVVVLPLAGRMSDVAGRLPVAFTALWVFSAGSLLTASSDWLAEAVTGRFLQGAGGGAIVPVTLALVADLWPPERRGIPLGVVGAVQELGAVLGPLFGAAVLALADWRAIFWVNVAIGAGLALALGFAVVRTAPPSPSHVRPGRRDGIGVVLVAAATVTAALAVARPAALADSVIWGGLLVPLAGDQTWTSPLAVAAVVLFAGFVIRELAAHDPLVRARRLPAVLRTADLPGALLLAVALGCVVIAFAAADPSVEVVGSSAWWLLPAAAAVLACFAWRQRRASSPLVPADTVRPRPAWGSLVVSLFVGAALVAVVVDVPILARTAIRGADQFDAALVLLRFLVALPIGALVGGWLVRRRSPAPVAAAGMLMATAGLAIMATWGVGSLTGVVDDVVLAATGAGFGLAVAPVNAAILAATPRGAHGVASGLLVVARMVGMLAGLSALTALGLRRLYAVQAGIEPPTVSCPTSPTDCPPYDDAVREAIVEQLQATFSGAAVCALIAALSAAFLLGVRGLTSS